MLLDELCKNLDLGEISYGSKTYPLKQTTANEILKEMSEPIRAKFDFDNKILEQTRKLHYRP